MSSNSDEPPLPIPLPPGTGPLRDRAAAHNAALLPCLRLIAEAAESEAARWVLMESLCRGIGLLHGRNDQQTAIFVENIAERLTEGARS